MAAGTQRNSFFLVDRLVRHQPGFSGCSARQASLSRQGFAINMIFRGISFALTAAVLIVLLQSPVLAQQPSLGSISTLADEKAAYTKWGWAWTQAQEPSMAGGSHTIGHLDVHSNLEADDLWQN